MSTIPILRAHGRHGLSPDGKRVFATQLEFEGGYNASCEHARKICEAVNQHATLQARAELCDRLAEAIQRHVNIMEEAFEGTAFCCPPESPHEQDKQLLSEHALLRDGKRP